QKKYYLPKLASGDYLGAFALTEPSAGSDAAKLKLKATRQDDVYILNGSKIFITNGNEADSFITFARTGNEKGAKGISAFIVEKNTPGFSVGTSEEKMGLHGTSTVTLHFDHCKIPISQRLGEEGQGFHIAMANLNGGRIGIAAQALGIAEAAYEYTREWARHLPEQEQHLLFTLADMATKVEAAKLMVYRAASLMEKEKKCIREVSTAKLLATRTAREITFDAIQTVGYKAARKGSPLERYVRYAIVTEIYEGTSEIQKVVISKQLAQSYTYLAEQKERNEVVFRLNDEQKMLQKMVRDFSLKEVEPTAKERDEEELFDRSIFDQMGELGLTGIPWSEEYGGIGSDFLSYAIAVEELSRVCASTGGTLSAHVSLASWPIYKYWDESQKEKLLKRLGEW